MEDLLKRKVVFLGDPMTGKTSFVNNFVHEAFSDSYEVNNETLIL